METLLIASTLLYEEEARHCYACSELTSRVMTILSTALQPLLLQLLSFVSAK